MDFEKMLTESLDEMIKACAEEDTNTNFIVMVDKVAVEPNSACHNGLLHKRPHTVKRFLHREAVELALKCQNGNGTKGKAVYWRDATEEAINDCERCIKFFEKGDNQ